MKYVMTRPLSKISILLCLSLAFPFTAQPVMAQNNSQITVQVGQPNIWSLGQAHYLLSAMRDNSRGLGVKVPVPTDLDPNSANGARLDVLRTLLSAGVEFNGPVGAQNKLNQQKFDTEFARYQAAQSRIDTILIPYTQAVSEVSNLKVQLDALPADKPENADQRKKLTEQIAQKTSERDALKAEIDELRKTQNASALTLAAPSPPGAITNNTPPDDLKPIFDAIVKGTTVPSLNASTVLDNYLQMQYEVIAKQLTLLRDEVGPNQRLVFLELPMSLYSVPKLDDNYVVQLQWNVTRFFGPTAGGAGKQDRHDQSQGEQYGSPGFVGEPINLNVVKADIRDIFDYISEQYGVNFVTDSSVGVVPVTVNATDVPWNNVVSAILKANELDIEVHGKILRVAKAEVLAREADEEDDKNQSEPITLDLLNNPERIKSSSFRAENPSLAKELSQMDWVEAARSKFRVVDIIPRQSALNVNDVHGTQNGFALAAKFLTVFGMGGQVSYQRQRSIYEQFMQQEVYASAFGKGMSTFGWTFGPLPGTKRLAPGVRTTYAILVIPSDALAIELNVKAKVYKRDRSPADSAVVKDLTQDNEGFGAGTFRILVPNEQTEGFWVDSVAYTPVEKGKQATMIINGKYFSPLTGILINGIPLKRTVSIAKNELPPNSQGSSSAGASVQNNSDPTGDYEYLNPQQLILSFKMDASYVGTPLITLITPEKTSAINYFKLDKINGYHRKKSLAEISQVEPMFTDAFNLASAELVDDTNDQYVTVYLRGAGLRRGARIFIGPRALDRNDGEEAEFISTGIYRVKFRRPPEGRAINITYSNTTKQVTQEARVPFQQTVASNYEIVRYELAAKGRPAVLDLVLSITGQAAAPTVEIDSRDGEVIGNLVSLGGNKYRVRIRAKRDPVPLSVTGGGVTRIFDIGIPVAPSIDRVVNMTTGKPEGPAAKTAIVALRGTNFQHVNRVLFGGKEATIMQVDPQVILVNAPVGEEGAVQVLLETTVNLRGTIISNIADFRTQGRAIYTYTK
jgi:hypothetical protein